MPRLSRVLMTLFVVLAVLPALTRAEATRAEQDAEWAARNDHSAYILPAGESAKADALYRARAIEKICAPLVGIIALSLVLQLRIAARMRDVAVGISRNRWVQGYTFFLLFFLFNIVASLPFDIYRQHLLRSDGLSVQGWGSWCADQGKGFALMYVFGGLGVMWLFFLIRRFPRRWWFWLCFPAVGFGVLSVFAGPYVIDPLFNKFEPLSKSNPILAARLEQVVARGHGIRIPTDRMFVMKASDKVTSLNAYVTGFGASKRIVVWDTTIARATPDQILPLFGHEMGHYVLGHILRNILFSCALIFISFSLGFYLFRFLLNRCGAIWGIPNQDDWAALVIFVMVINFVSFMASPIQNTFTRPEEHAADIYGEEIVHGIIADPQTSHQEALQLLGESNLATAHPSPFVEFWTDAAPPVTFRAAFAKHYDPWTAGAKPKYFVKDH